MLRETRLALFASVVTTAGLLGSAWLSAKLWPVFAAMLNAGLLLPGLLLTARVSRYRAEQGIPQPAFATLLMLAAIIVHSASLGAPAIIGTDYQWNGPNTVEVKHGNWVFTNALLFFWVASTVIPWWAANLLIALLPFAGGAHGRGARRVVIALSLALAALSWAPFIHQILVFESHRLVRTILWGYFLWAALCTTLGGVLALSLRATKP